MYEGYGARLLKTGEHTNTGLHHTLLFLFVMVSNVLPVFKAGEKHPSHQSLTHSSQGKIEGKFSITLHILFCVKKNLIDLFNTPNTQRDKGII